jgi:hypothetical protein
MTSSQEITAYRVGALELKLRGLGVYVGGEKLNAKVQALSPDEVRAANNEAWKARRRAEREMERYSNVTVHGNGLHDRATLDYMVAKAVCAATWQRMRVAA